MAQVQSGGQCAGEVVLGPPDAFLQTAACCQTAGDGGGERAAGAVGVGIGNSPGPEPQRFPSSYRRSAASPAKWPPLMRTAQRQRREISRAAREHVPFCFHRLAAEHLGLREVWRHQGTQRQQLLPKGPCALPPKGGWFRWWTPSQDRPPRFWPHTAGALPPQLRMVPSRTACQF